MVTDDILFEKLVLKGGNAISLVYGYGNRSSLDVDFSMEEEFSDLEDAKRRILSALEDRFSAAGYVVFDYPDLDQNQQRARLIGPELGVAIKQNSKSSKGTSLTNLVAI